jgi:hypothetical protein
MHELRGNPQSKTAAARPPHIQDVIEQLRATQTQFIATGSGEEVQHVGGASITGVKDRGFWAKIGQPTGSDTDIDYADGTGRYSFYEVFTSNSSGGVPSDEATEALELEGGRAGIHAAFEIAGRLDVPEGTLVWMTHTEFAPLAAGNAEGYVFALPNGPITASGQKFARITTAVGAAFGEANCLESITDCSHCPDGAPPSWTFTATGGTSSFAGLAGSWRLTHSSLCVWTGTLDTWSATLTFTSPTSITLVLTGPSSASLSYAGTGTVSCAGPLAVVLSAAVGTGTHPALSTLSASCLGAECDSGEAILVTPTTGACTWDDGSEIVVEPLDASQNLQAGHIYPVWLKDATTTPPTYLAASREVNYFQDITIIYVQVEINIYESTINIFDTTINYYDVDLSWTDVTITLLNPAYIYGDYPLYVYAPFYIGYGIQICGWTWYCAEGHDLWTEENPGPILDLEGPNGDIPPHTIAKLFPFPAVDGNGVALDPQPPIPLTSIIPIPPPVGEAAGQFLYSIHVGSGGADPLPIELGSGFLVPGISQLPLYLTDNDVAAFWWDADFERWRVMSTTYGDFRFADSAAQTVTIWNEGREADYIPPGNEGDVLTSRLDAETGRQAPVWQPLGGWFYVYKTDCVSGWNVRYKATVRFVQGVLTGPQADEDWEFDSYQGCCHCGPIPDEIATDCCDGVPETLCLTLTGGAEGTATLVYDPDYYAPGEGAWYGQGTSGCDGDTFEAEWRCLSESWTLNIYGAVTALESGLIVTCDPYSANGTTEGGFCGADQVDFDVSITSGDCADNDEPPPPPDPDCPCLAPTARFVLTITGASDARLDGPYILNRAGAVPVCTFSGYNASGDGYASATILSDGTMSLAVSTVDDAGEWRTATFDCTGGTFAFYTGESFDLGSLTLGAF